MKNHRLSIVIPVYNGEVTIVPLVNTVVETLSSQVTLQEIIMVNDGSEDSSHIKILGLVKQYPDLIKYIRLYRNFGEHNAVMAGLNYVTGDSAVIIDDDFQNPPSEIIRLVEKLQEGWDVVYSYYEKKRHSFFRNLGSKFNDRIATMMLNKPPDLYLSSFKAIDAALIRIIIQYKGAYPYIDGLILRSTRQIGKQLCQHNPRQAGKSNYTLMKLIHLWLNMFTGFSILPLRLVFYMGILISFLSIILSIYFIIARIHGSIIFNQAIPPGWASVIVIVTFMSGVQLLILGMLGEYLGRTLLMLAGNPQYIVRETYGVEEDK